MAKFLLAVILFAATTIGVSARAEYNYNYQSGQYNYNPTYQTTNHYNTYPQYRTYYTPHYHTHHHHYGPVVGQLYNYGQVNIYGR
jgi:hypothetical protein